jgi:hypothetical protein
MATKTTDQQLIRAGWCGPGLAPSEVRLAAKMGRSEQRRDRTDAEVQALGKKGLPLRWHRASSPGRSPIAQI